MVQKDLSDVSVKRLYYKRPTQCLASSKILLPHPLTARRFGAGEDTLAAPVGEGVGGQYFKGSRHSSVLYICKYFVSLPNSVCTLPPPKEATGQAVTT
jgi:hypothetical protein